MDLPVEVLIHIFQNLNHKDLKTVSLVSKFWRSAAEDKSLWRNCNVNIHLKKDFKLLKMLENPRFTALENLSLQGCLNNLSEIKNNHLKQISWLKLKKLSLSKISLQAASPEHFAQVVTEIKTVQLTHLANSTRAHVEALFNSLNSGSCVKNLKLDNWHWFDASEIEPEVVGSALNRLEELEIFSTKLESQHLRCLFRKINEQTNLKVLSFWNQNLSKIDPDILSGAVHRIPISKLCNAQLSANQIERILLRLSDISHLRILDIRNNENSRFVRPELKMDAVMALENFDCDTWPAFETENWSMILRHARYTRGDFDFDFDWV